MATVVPSDAAKDMGIKSLDAGILLSRDNFNIGGSMMAVMVTWCVNADSKATDGMTTPIIRSKLFPARRCIQLPICSDKPVRYKAPLSTKIAAKRMAGSLLKPESASCGSSTPVMLSAKMIRIAVRSMRIHSVNSRITDKIRMMNK